jgi:hypothetical protein
MQPSTFWKDLTEASAALLAAVAFFMRWVIAPATRNYLREDLKPELDKANRVPLLEERVERIEGAIEKLSEMPASLARIEGFLEERGR